MHLSRILCVAVAAFGSFSNNCVKARLDDPSLPPRPPPAPVIDVKLANVKPLKPRRPPPVFRTSVSAVKGGRPYMEDDYVIGGGGRFVGVFDGHGGSKVSLYLRQNLWPHLQTLLSPVTTKTGDSATLIKTSETSEVLSISSPQQSPRDILTADAFATKLQAAFKKIDADVQAIRHWSYQGSTAVCVYLLPDPQGGDELKIVSGNVGDSRAVLSRGQIAVDLTNDHKPNDPLEKSRVESLGGTVRWYGLTNSRGVPVEGSGVYRINGNLAVARAVGDRSERPFVSADCEVKVFDGDKEKDEFVILASDGLWDVMTSQQAVSFVNGMLEQGEEISENLRSNTDDRNVIRTALNKRKRRMARVVTEEALRRGSTDNVCVVIVWL